MEHFDIAILGAGAAGLFCAGSIMQLCDGTAPRVIVLDHAQAPGEKIRISGGGRCNFTNLFASTDRFLSSNPRFAASALAGYAPRDFVALVDLAGIGWHEKSLGQLFCDQSARQIVDLLLHRMRGAQLRLATTIGRVEADATGYLIQVPGGAIRARAVVVATGGKSIPRMGATGFGHDLARQFGLGLVEPRAGLVPLTFAQQDLDLCRPLAGISLMAEVRHGSGRRRAMFRDGLLFTHRGLSGPAILQISNFWQPGDEISVNLAPDIDIAAALHEARGQGGRVSLAAALARWLPARLASAIAEEDGRGTTRLAELSRAGIARLAERIGNWTLRPVGSEGWRTAEVTLGGVDTRALDSRSMQARSRPGLYFIGEVVDVTGWLGGYNFQWAWASGHAAARAIIAAA
ncbi:NAD(P)/FAD-dependent oxidoreductase [Paracoccus sp. (in: a-proteobacteria)]|uniref:NAD(P)/FAD-dependent oxidoreductase n=1 Tax=Paracoccus sp. TaxID=267 RepID=UPI00321FBA63